MIEDFSSSTHPLLPPTTEDDRLDWLRLLRSRRVGIATFYRLMAEHGSAAAALDALPALAAAAGLEDYRVCSERSAAAELAAARHARARMICRGEAAYPARLAEIDDAPPILWAVGDVAVLRRPMVALVGARNASSLGTRMARALAQGLAEAGVVTVSGLARGVDAAAHMASLAGGTVAVLGGGVDVLYPAENARLAEDIPAAGGVRLSEQPVGLTPQARHFPARNRLISGLARAVVVVEAAAKSGSLITARAALDQGREVLAVPGHPFDARAGGCNLLLRDGARLVRHAGDVLEALQMPAPETEPMQGRLDLDAAGSGARRGNDGGRPAPGAGPAGGAASRTPRATAAQRTSDPRPGAVCAADESRGAGRAVASDRSGGGSRCASAPEGRDGVSGSHDPDQGRTAERPRTGTCPGETATIPSGAAPAPPPGVEPGRGLLKVAELHGRILHRLGPVPIAEDQLLRDLGLPSGTVAPALTDLEIEGRIERRPGGLLALTV